MSLTGTPTQPVIVMQSVSEAAPALPDYAALLAQDERAQLRRLRRQADRDRFVLGRGLARSLLAAATGKPPGSLRFARNSHGKPRLEGAGGIAFNISHSDDLVLVAMAQDCEIGVDVERHRPGLDFDALGRFIFTEAERAAVRACDPAERVTGFFRQWVFKEALVKALGTGLARDPRRFQIRRDAGDAIAEFVGGEADDVGPGWRLAGLDAPKGYSAALAIRPRPAGPCKAYPILT